MVIQTRTYTVEEFEIFLKHEAQQDRLYELINGEIVEKVPTEEHGMIVLRIGAKLLVFVEDQQLGWVTTEARHRLPDDPHNDRLPDISFRSADSGPVVKRGAVLQMPDLAVEVKSPDDSYKEMREKAAYYLAHGSRMVWLVFPEKRIVEVYTPQEQQVLIIGDTLSGGEVLPDFTLPVEAVFPA